MQIFISNVTEKCYQKVAKPLLFMQKPDSVHERLLIIGTKIQNIRVVQNIIHFSLAYSNNSYLRQKVLGIQFINPVGLSAGFDKNFELLPLLKSVGFGFMEGGSLTFEPCIGNPKPWFYRLPKTKSLVVNAGLANEGVKTIIKRIMLYPKSTFDNFPINISVAKTNSKQASSETDAIEDYLGSLIQIKKSGVGDIITLNISCPNTYGGEPFTSPSRLEHLLKQVDRLHINKPIFIKMPSDLNWTEFDKLLQVVIKHQISGLTISNLAKDRGQIKLMDPLPKSVKGNLSGKPTWDLSNNLIKQTYQKYGDRFIIIGVGGIFSAEDAYTKIKLGASLVELITGIIFEGPQLVGRINYDLVKLLKKDGYKSVHEAIGSDLIQKIV